VTPQAFAHILPSLAATAARSPERASRRTPSRSRLQFTAARRSPDTASDSCMPLTRADPPSSSPSPPPCQASSTCRRCCTAAPSQPLWTAVAALRCIMPPPPRTRPPCARCWPLALTRTWRTRMRCAPSTACPRPRCRCAKVAWRHPLARASRRSRPTSLHDSPSPPPPPPQQQQLFLPPTMAWLLVQRRGRGVRWLQGAQGRRQG
jgi:hypothetical protein